MLHQVVGGKHHRVRVGLREQRQTRYVEMVVVLVRHHQKVGLQGAHVHGATGLDLEHPAVVHAVDQRVKEDAQLAQISEPHCVA